MLRGIDLQQILVQTEQVEKVQHTQQHPDRQQRYIDLQLKEEKRLLKAKVKDTEESGRALLRDRKDGSGESRGGSREEGAARVVKEEGEQPMPEEGRLIDIKV